jgi:hypothetical protein
MCLGILIGIVGTTVVQRRLSPPIAEITPRSERHPGHFDETTRWLGTKISGAPDSIIAAAFESDPPEPWPRKEIFAPFLSRGSQCKVVGWVGVIASVSNIGDARKVVVSIRPKLRGPSAVIFTTLESIETWHVSKMGTLEFVQAERHGDAGWIGD